MDKVFLDANVLFSAAYGSLGLKRLWNLSRYGDCQLLVSHYVIEEARHNLSTSEEKTRLENYLTQVMIVPNPPWNFPCPIPLPEKDRPVFTAAVFAGATHLITGDIRHFGEFYGKTFQGVLILPDQVQNCV